VLVFPAFSSAAGFPTRRPDRKEEPIVTRSKWLPLSTILIASTLALSHPAQAAGPQDPANQALEDHLKAARGDIMQRRDSAVRTLIKLEGDQAKTFAQLMAQYDAELKKIGEARRALLREYAKVYKNPSPDQAKDMAIRSIKLDEDRNALRRKYFDLMADKVSVLVAGQFLQLERQFETLMDVQTQSIVPLAGE
jgi:Spy/CpxP family protein refolding chaperone